MNPLDELPPIALPAEPGWWPPAPGWWVMGILLLCSLTLLIYQLIKRQRKLALKKNTLRRLDQLYSNCNNGTGSGSEFPRQQFVDCSAVLLRQFCIQQYGAESFASVTGERWLKKMDELADGNYLNNSTGKLLLNRYQIHAEPGVDEVNALYKALTRWLTSTTVNRQGDQCFNGHSPYDNKHHQNNRNALVNRQ